MTCPWCGSNDPARRKDRTGEGALCQNPWHDDPENGVCDRLADQHTSSAGAHFPYDVEDCPLCEDVRSSIFANSAAGREP